MFPIRVVVESVRSGECCRCSNSGNTVVDSYAIVNGQTPMPQLVDTVLSALSLQPLACGAKGMVEINNWRALSFEQVAECSPELTADMVLKDVSNHATLRILTKPAETATSDCAREMRERMLRTVMQRQPQILNTIKNPQLQDFVSALLQSDACLSSITSEQMQGFNHWLDELNGNAPGSQNGSASFGNGAAGVESSISPAHNTSNNNTTPEQQQLLANGLTGLTSGRFNDKIELPKLIRWFSENDNPSRQKIMQYVHVLNNSPFRKHHPQKISFQELSNWFAHARQLQRIQQMANSMLQAAAAANAINASRMQQPGAVVDLNVTSSDQTVAGNSNVDGTAQTADNGNGTQNTNNANQSQSSPSSSSFSNSSTNASSMQRSGNNNFDLNNLLHAKEQEERMKEQQNVGNGSELHSADSPESAGQLAAAGSAAGNNRALDSPNNELNISHDQSVTTPPPDGVHLNVDMLQMDNLNARVNADLAALINQANDHDHVNNAPLDLKMKSNFPTMGAGLGMGELGGNANLQAAAAAALFNPELMAQFQSQMENSEMFSQFKTADLLFPGASGNNLVSTVNGSPQYPSGTPDSSAISHQNSVTPGANQSGNSTTTPVNRSRLMFDPLSELPLLEKWFEDNPHPSWIQIDFYTDSLNTQSYRKQYPPISTHNVKIWFKNRRAKNKRLFDSAKQSAAAAMAKSEGLNLVSKKEPMQI